LRDPETGTVLKVKRRESVGHKDREKAEQAAKDKARALLDDSAAARVTSLRQLINRYVKEEGVPDTCASAAGINPIRSANGIIRRRKSRSPPARSAASRSF
jgi:hypothetical protein